MSQVIQNDSIPHHSIIHLHTHTHPLKHPTYIHTHTWILHKPIYTQCALALAKT